MTDKEDAPKEAKKGIGCWPVVIVLALAGFYWWYQNRPQTLEYPPDSRVQIHFYQGQPEDYQYLVASLVTDISDMRAPSKDNPLLSVAQLEPDGSMLPDGIDITWPLIENRPPGAELWIVSLDEDAKEWLATGEKAAVNPEGSAARGRVFHFSYTGLVDKQLSRTEPEQLRRPTQLNVPPREFTMAELFNRPALEERPVREDERRPRDPTEVQSGRERDPRQMMARLRSVQAAPLSEMPRFPEAKRGPVKEEIADPGILTLNDENWQDEVTDYRGLVVVVFIRPDYGKVELLGVESARLTPSPETEKYLTVIRAVQERYQGTVKFGILRREDGSMETWVRFNDPTSLTTVYIKNGREVGRDRTPRREEVVSSMIERYQ